MAELIKNVEHASIFTLKDLVEIEPGRVNSLTLSQTPGCKMTVFAIDADEGMSSHAASGDALITVLEGTGEITVNDVPHQLSAGQSIVMTSGSPHSVRGVTPFKMQLTVVKPAVEHASIFTLKDLVEIEPGRVNSLTLSQTPGCKMTVFAIDADEGMSSHAASGDALITVLEGTGEITVNDVPHQLSAGQSIVMTSGSPHSVRGVTPFKMQLTVVKPAE